MNQTLFRSFSGGRLTYRSSLETPGNHQSPYYLPIQEKLRVMADFRQLALDFVLEEDEAKLTELAQRAAKGRLLQTGMTLLSIGGATCLTCNP